jgi:hypothetical protein
VVFGGTSRCFGFPNSPDKKKEQEGLLLYGQWPTPSPKLLLNQLLIESDSNPIAAKWLAIE